MEGRDKQMQGRKRRDPQGRKSNEEGRVTRTDKESRNHRAGEWKM